MKDFLRILRRFVPPYKKFMVWNVIFNVLSAILNLFSFALIIPILNILFKISDETYTYTDWTFAPFSFEAWKATPELLKNNFFWFVSDMIETKGGSFTLIILGVFLIVSTFLKVGTMYMAFYTMIPIRTGVVRDIRNQINRKITELPLGFFSEERKGDIIARVSGDVNEIETSIMSSLDMLDPDPDLPDRDDRHQLAADAFCLHPAAFRRICDGNGRKEVETEIVRGTATMGVSDESDRGDVGWPACYQGFQCGGEDTGPF